MVLLAFLGATHAARIRRLIKPNKVIIVVVLVTISRGPEGVSVVLVPDLLIYFWIPEVKVELLPASDDSGCLQYDPY